MTLLAGAASAMNDGDDGNRRGGTSCKLGSADNPIKHIVHIQFDNVHLRRDNPNVPSDLEQMPNLLDFLEDNGTVLTNHHTPLISHTAVDILTTLTGTYGDKMGVPIGNSFGFFQKGGISFSSSFGYWTDPLANGEPLMIDRRGKIHPAPWVAFTRAGCNVGAFSVANIEFENVGNDITTVFGANSPQAAEVKANFDKAVADFEGIAIHCAANSPLCAKNAAPDVLTDEPGGYVGFQALYGNANVQPQISPNGPVKDLDGIVVSDGPNGTGNPGFPGFDPSASQTLGYLAQMLETGVPVVYGYIADAHDNHVSDGTFGPGETGYVAQLKAYDVAFGKFFARLKKDSITKENTLFIVTADENDHFVGGPASPAGCDGIHVPCTYTKKGEVDADLSRVFATQFKNTTVFKVHSDDAPTIYINSNPGQTDPITRTLERQAGALIGFDPVVGANGSTNFIAQALADHAEQDLLHMITQDPSRTPNFILFANPDYFLFATGHTTPDCPPKATDPNCFQEEPGFAWSHGDFQNDITHTWLAMVGPGVRRQGRSGDVFTDHTDIRPTLMSLTGLTDDYAHDGRVVFEIFDDEALPKGLRRHGETLSRLAHAYKQINAPRGKLGAKTLVGISTSALKGDDATYAQLEAKLTHVTMRRNEIAGQMIAMLENAAFHNQPIDEDDAERLIKAADELLETVN